MSETESREVLHREFPVELETDGRNVDVRIVPFNVAQRVTDPPPFGTGIPYEEMWLPGAFDKQTDAANRVEVLANFEHHQGINNVVGKGTQLRDTGDALEGTFRMMDGQDGDKMLDLVTSGHVRGVSLEAQSKKTLREDGVVKRVKAHLINIAFCRNPAFPQAEVLAVRTEQDMEPVIVDLGDDLTGRLNRIGIERISRCPVVRGPWNPAQDRFEDEQWQASCVLDRGSSFEGVKARFAMPVLEPNGDLNIEALHAQARKIGQVFAGDKAAAARKLVRYYRMAGEQPPASLLSAASR